MNAEVSDFVDRPASGAEWVLDTLSAMEYNVGSHS